jgi:hypothetical protein
MAQTNARGWATTGTSVTTLAAAHGRFPPTDHDDAATAFTTRK